MHHPPNHLMTCIQLSIFYRLHRRAIPVLRIYAIPNRMHLPEQGMNQGRFRIAYSFVQFLNSLKARQPGNLQYQEIYPYPQTLLSFHPSSQQQEGLPCTDAKHCKQEYRLNILRMSRSSRHIRIPSLQLCI